MANDDGEYKTAIAAVLVAVVAFFTTVVQLAQAIIASARGLPNCDERVMGQWAKYTSRKLKWSQLRLEVHFEAPIIFLARKDNTKGPQGSEIYYATGDERSCAEYQVAEPISETAEVSQQGEPVHTVDNELCSWVKLLGAIQKMEKTSLNWERNCGVRGEAKRNESDILAVGMQRKKRSFDTNPSVRRPYATTTICHIVELAACLGLHWKEFDRNENKYRAEGNGYSLLGTRLDDPGIVFDFERFGWPQFEETRIIPTTEIKELVFGRCPTLYREQNRIADDYWSRTLVEQKNGLQTLQLGSRRDIAETLNLIRCNTTTVLYFVRGMKHIHLFPGESEICMCFRIFML